MGLQSLYDRLPVALQTAMVTAHGLQLNHLRYGGNASRYAEDLQAHEAWEWEQVQRLQFQLLKSRAELAIEQVPAYRSLSSCKERVKKAVTAEEILSCFPVLTKEEVRQDPRSFVPAGLSEKLALGETGGTTGKPLVLYRTRSSIRHNFAFFARTRRWRGLTHLSRTATFMGRLTVPQTQDKPPFWRHAKLTNNLLFSSFHISKTTLASYVRALQKFGPEQIVCYPSSGFQIAAGVIDMAVRIPGIRAVFTTAETITQNQRRAMEEAFSCPVADQYGSGEWAAWISQCPNGQYHVHPEYGYLEVLDSAGGRIEQGTGRAVATGFINNAMVLMRYETGDLLSIGSQSCRCSLPFPVVDSIEGRVEELVHTPDGRSIGRLNNFVFSGVRGVIEGQLVQPSLDRLIVRIVPGTEWCPESHSAILRSLRSHLGEGMTFIVETTDSIDRTPGGKLRAVIGLPSGRQPLQGNGDHDN